MITTVRDVVHLKEKWYYHYGKRTKVKDQIYLSELLHKIFVPIRQALLLTRYEHQRNK